MSVEPRHAKAHYLLGLIAAGSGRSDQAAELIEKAIGLGFDDPEAHFNLGNLTLQRRRASEAVACFRRAISRKPNYLEAHANLGAALHELGRDEEAVAAYRRAIGIEPNSAAIHNNLGNALRALGRHEQAATSLRTALRLDPSFAEAHNNLGAALHDMGRTDEAIASYRRAIELRPGNADPYVNLSEALQVIGDNRAALFVIDQALAQNSSSARAWRVRSGLKMFAPGDPDIDRMDALLRGAEINGLGRKECAELEFALGKALMDAGEADRAFANFEAGNKHVRAGYQYHVEDDVRSLSAIERSFSADVMHRLAGRGDPSDTPIFIVGMPRSGSTLVEQVLASHPQIHGAGELKVLGEMFQSPGQSNRSGGAIRPIVPSAGALAELGDAYVEQVKPLAVGKRHVVDKMTGNFRFAGLIYLMLPNARIIHCRRDPVETCLSCYSNMFAGGLKFAYDLRELGVFYRAYDALMAHWRRLLPVDRFIEVAYEDIVEDLEGQARRLIEFCQLPWDAACLDFHATRRPVRTASVNQVRRPIYRTSLARSRRYAAHLGPLVDALGFEGLR